jgi:hypothetical protein
MGATSVIWVLVFLWVLSVVGDQVLVGFFWVLAAGLVGLFLVGFLFFYFFWVLVCGLAGLFVCIFLVYLGALYAF